MTDNGLGASGAFYKRLFEVSGTIKLVIDPLTSGIVEANPAAAAFYGYSRDALMTKRMLDLNTLPESELLSLMQSVLSRERTTIQTQHRLADGAIRDVEVFVTPVDVDDRVYLYALVSDISERKQMETALRKQETLYRLLVQNMPDASVMMFDTAIRCTLVEGTFLEFLNLTSENLIGKTPHEVLEAHFADYIAALSQRVINGETFTVEDQYQGHAFKMHMRPLQQADGTIIGGITLIHDITERKRLEDALRASEERLRLITDNLPDLVTMTDGQRKAAFISPSFKRVLGYELEAIENGSILDYIHPDDQGHILETILAARSAGQPGFSTEFRLRHADGHYLNAETLGTFTYDQAGEFLGTVLITRDITERKRLADALRASEERLRVITDNIQDLVVLTDGNQRTAFVSPSFKPVLGYDPEKLMGAYILDYIHPDDRKPAIHALYDAWSRSQASFTTEFRLLHADGHYVDAETLGKFSYDAQGQFIGTVLIARDITERKRLHALTVEKERLQERLRQEAQLSMLKSRMMDRINHEFRTPLTVIHTSAETLNHYYDRLPADQRAAKVDTIKTQVRYITAMLEGFAQVIHTPYAPGQLHRRPADVSALCRIEADRLAAEYHRPDRFRFSVSGDCHSRVDPKTLCSAFNHLLRNALRFSSAGQPVTVQLTARPDGVDIRITDEGIGIPQADLPHIFEPLFRGSNIGEISGLGIGLTLAQAAVEAHGGTLTVTSTAGRETTASIWLPHPAD